MPVYKLGLRHQRLDGVQSYQVRFLFTAEAVRSRLSLILALTTHLLLLPYHRANVNYRLLLRSTPQRPVHRVHADHMSRGALGRRLYVQMRRVCRRKVRALRGRRKRGSLCRVPRNDVRRRRGANLRGDGLPRMRGGEDLRRRRDAMQWRPNRMDRRRSRNGLHACVRRGRGWLVP